MLAGCCDGREIAEAEILNNELPQFSDSQKLDQPIVVVRWAHVFGISTALERLTFVCW
jgi:hypothetical protein